MDYAMLSQCICHTVPYSGKSLAYRSMPQETTAALDYSSQDPTGIDQKCSDPLVLI